MNLDWTEGLLWLLAVAVWCGFLGLLYLMFVPPPGPGSRKPWWDQWSDERRRRR